MKTIIRPEPALWPELCRRPVLNTENLTGTVTAIMENVRQNGDNALREYALKFDGAALNSLAVTEQEIEAAEQALPENLKVAIRTA
ncbi:MAG: histidinol dehydrogenase, partial [Dinghuibacter sp.]|nr:histidinol dehydrogenase [Dinghuibacter sp.]